MRLYEVTTPGACPRTKATECSCESLRRLAEAEQPIKAVAVLGHGDAKGIITFVQKPGKATIISGSISGLTEGLHGFHIHEFGDLSDGCDSAGGHYNPHGVDHGDIDNGHVGDLGNIQADSEGVATFKIKSKAIQLQGATSIVGRAVVVHEDQDDLGKGGDEESLKTGNAGNRAGCGVITLSELTESAIADLDKNISDKHFNRNEMPQVKEPDLIDNEIPYKKGKISIANIKPVQTDRVPGLAQKVAKNFYGKDKPFIIDVNNYLVNGHHRYDAARLLGIEKVDAIKVNVPIELLMKQFSHTTSDTMVEHLSDEASTPEIHNKALQMAKDAYRKSNEQISFTKLYDKALEILEPAKVDEYGVPDYNTMPTYKLKKAHKGKQKFFLPSNEPTPKGVQAIENVTDYPEITQSKAEEIISAWEWQENVIKIGNGMMIIPAQKQDGTMHMRPDGKGGSMPYDEKDALLIDKDYNVLDFDTDIEDLLNNNFAIIQGENFADGKKKGKSRPGRVKRSGASCKGSVTSLRAKAKKYSGERAKMYHWCANMKSGKKKTNEDIDNLSPSAKLAGEYIDSDVKSGKIKNLDDLKRYIVELRLSRIIDHAEDARALWIHHLTVNPHNLPDAVNESAFENLKLPTWMSHTSLEKLFAQEYGPRYGDYVAHMDLDSDDDLAMNASGMGDMAFEMVKANDIKVMQKFLAQMPVQFTVDDLRLDDGIQVWHLVQQNKTVH
jgi:Cu-Zn family superoxide dismutase